MITDECDKCGTKHKMGKCPYCGAKKILPKRTDEEIKAWIDAREALTAKELMRFMYFIPEGQKLISHTHSGMMKWWKYVLATKNWEKLNEYRENKIKHSGDEKFKKYQEIYGKDERIRKAGVNKRQEILDRIYKFHLSLSTLSKYNSIIHDTHN